MFQLNQAVCNEPGVMIFFGFSLFVVFNSNRRGNYFYGAKCVIVYELQKLNLKTNKEKMK